MIELRRIVLVNWHMMVRADLDLAGDAAILGQNRSGKSTIIDLIQAIMAGGSSRLYRFNRSAARAAAVQTAPSGATASANSTRTLSSGTRQGATSRLSSRIRKGGGCL
ncbi:hypothetical protein NKH60_26115 [Mesorhizobium sp. M1006]|uniref:ATP-binding protein n=1 Tax=Mesorhizobium sp. M1006 TaxID=2957048 RepID=UPI00333D3077